MVWFCKDFGVNPPEIWSTYLNLDVDNYFTYQNYGQHTRNMVNIPGIRSKYQKYGQHTRNMVNILHVCLNVVFCVHSGPVYLDNETPLYLLCASFVSPLCLPCASFVSPLCLLCVSFVSPLYLLILILDPDP